MTWLAATQIQTDAAALHRDEEYLDCQGETNDTTKNTTKLSYIILYLLVHFIKTPRNYKNI